MFHDAVACSTVRNPSCAARSSDVLEEEIAARVAGQTELGAQGIVGAGRVHRGELLDVGGRVEGGVGDADLRHAHRHPHEAVPAHVEKVGVCVRSHSSPRGLA